MKFLVITTVTKIDHLSNEEAKALALKIRGEGKRSAILSYDEACALGLFSNMQDLTKL